MAGEHLEQVAIESAGQLRSWLESHHQQTASVWLVVWKKHMGARHIPWPDIVDEALCFGWVDSLPRKLDEDRSMLLLSPRKRGSAWSGINKAKVERLINTGRMTAAGLAKINAAKADGSWAILDDVDRLEKPADLNEALAAYPAASSWFDSFPPSTRRGILEWIKQAKSPETRARRIAETARLAQDNIRANQPRKARPVA
jgi:uncharacterized protein YdeI (YjbR/CyaY-like superfamily)